MGPPSTTPASCMSAPTPPPADATKWFRTKAGNQRPRADIFLTQTRWHAYGVSADKATAHETNELSGSGRRGGGHPASVSDRMLIISDKERGSGLDTEFGVPSKTAGRVSRRSGFLGTARRECTSGPVGRKASLT